jgi:flagellar motor switch protein FliN/FliY
MAGEIEGFPMTPAIHELAAEWRECFSRAMEAMSDTRPAIDFVAEGSGPAASLLWWRQNMDASPGAAVWLGASKSAWQALGLRILAAAGIDNADEEERKGAYLEVLRQSLSALATAIGGQLGREVLATDGAEEEPAATLRSRLTVSLGQESIGEFWLCANAELVGVLPGAIPAPPPAEANTADEGLGLSARACGTLNLLLDVELPVSVSFGRTQVRVQEVLKLITGSIIELDRSISEPVEVIVNNTVVARGEVVVVDGNYGVRIQEVMSRRERLQESRKYLLPLNRAS